MVFALERSSLCQLLCIQVVPMHTHTEVDRLVYLQRYSVKLFHQSLHSWWLQCLQCTSHCRPEWRWPLPGQQWWWRDELLQDPPELQCNWRQETLHHSVGSPTELQQWYSEDHTEQWWWDSQEKMVNLKECGDLTNVTRINQLQYYCFLAYLQCLGMLCYVVKLMYPSGQSMLQLFQVTHWW